MSIYESTIIKLKQLPEPLAQEVSDFIDSLLTRRDKARWELWSHFNEALDLSESDFSDYLGNLEEYEERLVRGEVRW
jgi:hypothetical protein